MLTYEKFITERRMSGKTKTWLSSRSKPYQYWLSASWAVPFPFSKPMMERMQMSDKGVTAYHVTNVEGLISLIDNQNSARQLSTFTEIGDVQDGMELIKFGVNTEGGILAELKGDSVFTGNYDVFTSPDSQGRRWLDLKQFMRAGYGKRDRSEFMDAYVQWEKRYRYLVNNQTEKFINQNKSELLNYYSEEELKNTIKDFDIAKAFWAGNQDYMVKTGYEPNQKVNPEYDQKYAWKDGIIKYIEEWMGEGKTNLSRKARQSIFKLTKSLFDASEKFFEEYWPEMSDLTRTDDFDHVPYNEVILDNYNITQVYVNLSDLDDNNINNFSPLVGKLGLQDIVTFVDDSQLKQIFGRIARIKPSR